jgi:hypothetical protein
VRGGDLAAIAIVAIVVAVMLARRGHRLLFATFDPDGAHAAGIERRALLTVHDLLLALAFIACIRVVGIVLVNRSSSFRRPRQSSWPDRSDRCSCSHGARIGSVLAALMVSS